jgi:hypothetical protein
MLMRSSQATATTVATTQPDAGHPLPFAFTAVLSATLAGATLLGLVADSFYRVSPGVRGTLPAVLRGQDLLTLLTVPLLLWSARQARAGVLVAHLVWLGLLLYYAYSYVMYAFAPFTDAFLAYCLIIAMSGYGFLNGLLRLDLAAIGPSVTTVPRRGLGVFLLVVAGAFVALWLAMIVPAIPGGLPEGRVTYDIASAVHVLDLSVMLPLVAGTGWLLLRAHPAGPILGVVLLCKIITLALAMCFMNLVFLAGPNPGEVAMWVLVGGVAAAFLAVTLRRMTNPAEPWIHARLWR